VLADGIVNNGADNLITYATAVLGFEMIKYLRSKILFHKVLPMNKYQNIQFLEKENQNTISLISIMTHEQ
jgi:hypothetical protein